MSLDMLPVIRSAFVDQQDPALQPLALLITNALSQWNGEPAIFTRRPVPDDAVDPMIIINPPAAIGDEDGLTSERPIWVGDIAIYGVKAAPGDASDQTRIVELAALRTRQLFHRQKFSVRPEGYSVTGIVAAGPIVAPVDDEATVGRLVTLTIRLRRIP